MDVLVAGVCVGLLKVDSKGFSGPSTVHGRGGDHHGHASTQAVSAHIEGGWIDHGSHQPTFRISVLVEQKFTLKDIHGGDHGVHPEGMLGMIRASA